MTMQEIVGHNISICREAKGFTLEELAAHCNLDQTQLRDIEQGKSSLVANEFFLVAQMLDSRPVDLLLGE
ncbi:MAG: helix-turn-helix transcriptional regulator [Gammaproteobacteria bacterium]|nr:helix-turn-helix transcriptional regulator [Gammaproteobacteria bacterium]